MIDTKITTLTTGATLKLIAPTLSQARADDMAGHINAVCPAYQIDTINEFEEFIAQVLHESGAFRIKEENMNYSAARMLQVWPTRFKTLADAAPFAKNPKALANKVYGGRMGNTLPNDGYDFRGSGFMQLTGRESATLYAKYKGVNDPVAVTNLLRTDDRWALDAACWEFSVNKKLLQLAEEDQFVTITKRINGGTIGMQDRLYYYNRAKLYLRNGMGK